MAWEALHDGWTVQAVGGDVPQGLEGVRIPATVPGCVHLDLMAAGLVPDPYVDENEAALTWIGRVDWRWETTFAIDPARADGGEHVDLVALGLDTVATVEVNDAVVARTANMHRSHRLPIAHLLQPGANTLAVTIAAGRTAAERANGVLGPRPHVNPHPYNAIRTMACAFGWDWGPDAVTAGIWRPIGLDRWRGARIAALRPLVGVDGDTGRLTAHVDLERDDDATALTLEVTVGDASRTIELGPGRTATTVEVEVPGVRLWWPRGHGDQPLYPVTATLSRGAHDVVEARVGFRTVELDTTPDENGTPFTIVVNGEPVFARGVNWIPDDVFLPRVTRERYRERITQAVGANVNLVRVWGGGVYESDDLYDACDELGVLVWQDFLFACAAYAEEEPLRGEVIAEAREAVTRLSPHPSLVLWNGGNENLWGHEDWGWKDQLGDLSWGLGYYDDVLPGIVAELDPTRPYCPGSPWSPGAGHHPNDPAHGTTHLWDVWNRLGYEHYRDAVPRFVSEFGFQGPPAWATLTRAVHDDPLRPDGPALLAHQKADDGQAKLLRGLRGHLPEPASFDDWHWATSLNQARAVALGVEHARSWSPVCSGAIVWQLNDCWPVVSWAAVDGDGRRKPLWYALRRSFADRLLTVQPRDGGLALVAVNDTATAWTEPARVTRRSFDGTVLAQVTVSLGVPPRATRTAVLPAAVAGPGDAAREVLIAEAGGHRAWWYFAEDVDGALPPADLDVSAESRPGGVRLTVTARTFVRDLAVLADRVAPDAVVDDMLVTLLPGESTVVDIDTAAGVDPAAFTGPLVVRSANQLVAGDA